MIRYLYKKVLHSQCIGIKFIIKTKTNISKNYKYERLIYLKPSEEEISVVLGRLLNEIEKGRRSQTQARSATPNKHRSFA